jgi:hypothetical protein
VAVLDDKTTEHRVGAAHVVVAVVAAATVAFATRQNPLLSPDSITYLSAAERLRSGGSLVDFTGEPLTHFPPVFPLLLAPGGTSLVWASIIGVAAASAVATLLFDLLNRRIRTPIAFVAALVYTLSQAALYHETTVWSETPYLALALATISVLARQPLTVGRCALAGAFAGLGFLTRYVGAGLVVAGLLMVLASTLPTGLRSARRCSIAYLATPTVLAIGWVARNLIATGEPLGPHFEGGSGSSAVALVRQLTLALGQLVSDIDATSPVTRALGYVALVGLVVCAWLFLARPPRHPVDVGIAGLAAMSIVVPVVSSIVAGTDLSARLVSPTLVAIVYFAGLTVDRWVHNRALTAVAGAMATTMLFVGIDAAGDTPDRLTGSSDNAELHSPELHDLVAALPDGVGILTNNPQRVWWHTHHFPVRLAFTEPKPGNSHFPISPNETLDAACAGDAYLAWFSTLRNAGETSPGELRPDLAQRVSLTVIDEVTGGTLFALGPVDPATCG